MTDIGFDIPDHKKVRVIVDTDAACEADDAFAIVHALLSPKLIVRGVIAEHFNVSHSMEDSFDEISALKQAMAIDFPSFMGQNGPLSSDPFVSEGVDFIIKEALSDSPHPLFVLCQGAITNVAMAIKTNPDIIGRMTIIWIGTHGEAPCTAPFREFNAGIPTRGVLPDQLISFSAKLCFHYHPDMALVLNSDSDSLVYNLKSCCLILND